MPRRVRDIETAESERGKGTSHRDAGSPPRSDYLRPTFDEFFLTDYAAVLAFARATSGSWSRAEDLTQEAFIAAHRSWERVSRYDRPDAFVRRVVANRSASLWRRAGREAAALERLSRAVPRAPVGGLSTGDDEFWERVRRLPARQSQVLALHYLEDRSVIDIATVLGLAEGTVKAHLHSARRTLAAQLGEVVSVEDA